MEVYKFALKDRNYELREDNCNDFINDEENPVEGLELSKVLEILKESHKVDFGLEYYGEPCEDCLAGKEEKAKYFNFLEYHFYVFTKDSNYVMSNISKEYESTSFTQLFKRGKVDNSYIVSVIVCENCGSYSIEIEQCEM